MAWCGNCEKKRYIVLEPMNLFHHEEPEAERTVPVSDFKRPVTHGENRSSSFGRPHERSEMTPHSQLSNESGSVTGKVAPPLDAEAVSDAPPVVTESQASPETGGPRKVGMVESSSARMHNPNQPNLFGQMIGGQVGTFDTFGNPIGAVIVGYDAFGNPIYQNQGQGNAVMNGVVQGVAAGVAAEVAMDVVGGILDSFFQN